MSTPTRAKTAVERAWITGTSWCLPECDQIIVAEGHAIFPKVVEQMHADSFVMPCFDLSRGNIHDPTENSLIRDGLRKII